MQTHNTLLNKYVNFTKLLLIIVLPKQTLTQFSTMTVMDGIALGIHDAVTHTDCFLTVVSKTTIPFGSSEPVGLQVDLPFM